MHLQLTEAERKVAIGKAEREHWSVKFYAPANHWNLMHIDVRSAKIKSFATGFNTAADAWDSIIFERTTIGAQIVAARKKE